MGRKSIYKPMLKKLKVGEYLTFYTQNKATACVHAAKKMGIVVNQSMCRPAYITLHHVTRIRKPRKK